MIQEQVFFHAMTDAAADGTAPLVFADWLEERGDPRGELLRLHHELLHATWMPQRWVLEQHLQELLSAGVQACWPSITTELGLELVFLPAGRFLMGAESLEAHASPWEWPQHLAEVPQPFWLGRYPVTQGEYEQVMGQNPSPYRHHPRCPVQRVSWHDAHRFCNALSRRERLPPYYEQDSARGLWTALGGPGYRLPSETEWEYACRAGTTTPWSFGLDANRAPAYAWFREDFPSWMDALGLQRLPRVGRKRPNPFGLCDLHGLVWEWCENHPAPYVQPAREGSTHWLAEMRVLRGGSYCSPLWELRSACRRSCAGRLRENTFGFRVARNCE